MLGRTRERREGIAGGVFEHLEVNGNESDPCDGGRKVVRLYSNDIFSVSILGGRLTGESSIMSIGNSSSEPTLTSRTSTG